MELEALFKESLEPLANLPSVHQVRCLGAIAAVELKPETPAPAVTRPHRVRELQFKEGILLRPLGNVVYLMPPLIISEGELRGLISEFTDSIRNAG